MNICGLEFNFSALNANDLDRMERAQQHMHAASDREKQRVRTNDVGMADILRGQCRLVMGYLDEVLGEGASKRLGLDGNDFGACKRVMTKLKEAIIAEQAAVRQETAVPMSREQRRAAAKQKKTVPYKIVSTPKTTTEETYIRGQTEVSYGGEPDVTVPDLTDEQKTDQLIDAQQAVNDLRDDPDALQQLAEYALKLASERHV